MVRYARGLIGAYLVFGVVYGVGVVSVALLEGQPHRILEFLAMGVFVASASVLVLAMVIGPLMVVVRQLLGRRLPIIAAGLFGAAAGFGFVLLFWVAFRDHDETLAGLLQFWRRVPGEFLIGVLPHAAASAFFCVWLASEKPRLKLRAASQAAATARR